MIDRRWKADLRLGTLLCAKPDPYPGPHNCSRVVTEENWLPMIRSACRTGSPNPAGRAAQPSEGPGSPKRPTRTGRVAAAVAPEPGCW